MAQKTDLVIENIPKHIAVIMDGNGRWAKKQGKLRIFGHENGVKAVRDTVEACAEIGVEYLTLYAFSTENWNRPKFEINALMTLLVSTINKETKTYFDYEIEENEKKRSIKLVKPDFIPEIEKEFKKVIKQ